MKKNFLLLLLYLIISFNGIASNPVLITDKDINELHFWRGNNLEIIEDQEDLITIEDILSSRCDTLFKNTKADVPIAKGGFSYWAKVTILRNTTDDYKWVFEAYDQSIDFLEFYAPDNSGKYKRYNTGDNTPFSTRQYLHKNYVFDLSLPSGKPQTIYLKIKGSHTAAFIGVVRNTRSFVSYALHEYFYLALFYGLVISMIIFNLLQYTVTRSKIYLVYVVYIFTAGLFSASLDGLGFHFIWRDFPILNVYLSTIANYLVISLCIILTYQFLKETNLSKNIFHIGLAVLVIRLLLAVLSILGIELVPLFLVDILIRIFILIVSLQLLLKGYKQIRYFTLGIAMLVLGYTIRELTTNGLFLNTIFTVYAHLFGEALQMIFISLALGERIKIKMQELVITQKQTLQELEQNNLKTEKLRKNLQARVEEQIAKEKFSSEGISNLSNIIAENLQDTKQLYPKLTKFIAEYFESRLCALYLKDSQDLKLTLVAGYGLDESRLNNNTYTEKDGLIGQCLKNKERIELRNLPEEYIEISSGLGKATPLLVILEPLYFNQQIVGILEMAFFKELTPLHYELLTKLTSQIASTLSNVIFNEATKKMLQESITKEELLRQQEEEMRQQMEELFATQEDFERKEQEYLKEIERLTKKS